jgi:hypothetical protein
LKFQPAKRVYDFRKWFRKQNFGFSKCLLNHSKKLEVYRILMKLENGNLETPIEHY